MLPFFYTDLAVLDIHVVILGTDVAFLDTGVVILGTDVAVLDTGVVILDTDVAVLDTDFSNLDTDVAILDMDAAILDTDVAFFDTDIAVLDTDLHSTFKKRQETRIHCLEYKKPLQLADPFPASEDDASLISIEWYFYPLNESGGVQTDNKVKLLQALPGSKIIKEPRWEKYQNWGLALPNGSVIVGTYKKGNILLVLRKGEGVGTFSCEVQQPSPAMTCVPPDNLPLWQGKYKVDIHLGSSGLSPTSTGTIIVAAICFIAFVVVSLLHIRSRKIQRKGAKRGQPLRAEESIRGSHTHETVPVDRVSAVYEELYGTETHYVDITVRRTSNSYPACSQTRNHDSITVNPSLTQYELLSEAVDGHVYCDSLSEAVDGHVYGDSLKLCIEEKNAVQKPEEADNPQGEHPNTEDGKPAQEGDADYFSGLEVDEDPSIYLELKDEGNSANEELVRN
ncbi:DNA-directed RNA polymerase subunit [Elysia marginata]|uniref:DNA-directed RNA polymerase subunit n=1 Tax=Elysia marginata TaxID=1093978 RepID=A0AAV4JBH5_9GAST|nr:DNA-directed RNA polymerase subunit [Elysia marginata]